MLTKTVNYVVTKKQKSKNSQNSLNVNLCDTSLILNHHIQPNIIKIFSSKVKQTQIKREYFNSIIMVWCGACMYYGANLYIWIIHGSDFNLSYFLLQ